MAYLTGVIEYLGSFKSIRHWRNRKNRRIFAGEKGGANIDLIKNNAAFVRTRENMAEFKGVGMAVKAMRYGLSQLLPEHADTQFTARLIALVKMINLRDLEGTHGKRAISFSLNKAMLKAMNLHEKRKIDFLVKKCIKTNHPESRSEATITVNGLNPATSLVPGTPQYYRVINHLSIVSDYVYNESNRGYNPQSPLNRMAAFVYSDYAAVNTPLSVELMVAFPDGTVLSENDTVLQCVGIEFYNRAGADGYSLYSTGTMLLYDVF